jgi:predicted nucleotide-binding protein
MDTVGTIADELSDVAEQALMIRIRFDVMHAPISELRKITEEAKRSWSGSNIGYHADVYFAGLQPAPPGAQFSSEWGLMERWGTHSPDPSWRIMDRRVVIDALLDRAGLSTAGLEAIESELDSLGALFSGVKERTISLLTAANSVSPDQYLVRKLDQAEKLILASPSEIERRLVPTKVFSRDSRAIHQGPRAAPHQSLVALVLAADLVKRGLETIESTAREAAAHIKRLSPSQKSPVATRGNVFIGHGGSSVWRELRDFLKERLGVPVEEFNSISAAGKPTAIRLFEMLDSAVFAFLVMTAEDEQPDGTVRARENVVHEAGLFQGRLGFTRAIVVLEEGCEEFSNIRGLGQIRFPRGKISAAFEEIRLVLEREKIV